MNDFWIAAIKVSPLGAIAGFLVYFIFPKILGPDVLGKMSGDQAFYLTIAISFLTFFVCVLVLGMNSSRNNGNTIKVIKSSGIEKIVGGDDRSNSNRADDER